jgi:hypothetical protein
MLVLFCVVKIYLLSKPRLNLFQRPKYNLTGYFRERQQTVVVSRFLGFLRGSAVKSLRASPCGVLVVSVDLGAADTVLAGGVGDVPLVNGAVLVLYGEPVKHVLC